MKAKKATVWLVALALAGIPLTMAASCEPRGRTINVYRDDDECDGHRCHDWHDWHDCILPFVCF